MNTELMWIEIPVASIVRAVKFYESILDTKLELKELSGSTHAIFDKKTFGIGGSLIEVKDYQGSNGIKPMIYVQVLQDALDKVNIGGGKIITGRTLLRQKNKSGNVVIGTNLIDEEVGYFAEIIDTEGNHLYLYSHS